MNVLSLFDGISCGQVALERAGIKVSNYYASEIDKYAIKITQRNHPKTIQLGDIETINLMSLPKIDLLMGGSPCQGFSFAGKQLNFNDSRSKLFFNFVEILGKLLKFNPSVKFLLENVKMKKEYQNVISMFLGVEPIEINSALVSAQNRKRLYWTNIDGVKQPKDRGILLKDIVFDDSQFSYLVPRGNNPGGVRAIDGKQGAITANSWEHNNFILQFPHGRTKGGVEKKDKSPCVTTSFHRNVFRHRLSEKAIAYMDKTVKGGRTHWDFKHHSDVVSPKSATVVANFFKGVPFNVLKDWNCVRKFDPIECERLQTLPDNYTEGVSNTQRYKSIGNGWTVDVITHLLKL